MGLCGDKWEPGTGLLADFGYGRKQGDRSGTGSKTVNSGHDPAISEKAAEAAHRATYEAELHGPPNTEGRPDK